MSPVFNRIRSLNKESVISVTGIVRERDNKNPKIPTGDIEVEPEKTFLFLQSGFWTEK